MVVIVFFTWLQIRQTNILQRAYHAVDAEDVFPFEIGENNTVIHVAVRDAGKLPATNVQWFIDAEMIADGR